MRRSNYLYFVYLCTELPRQIHSLWEISIWCITGPEMVKPPENVDLISVRLQYSVCVAQSDAKINGGQNDVMFLLKSSVNIN